MMYLKKTIVFLIIASFAISLPAVATQIVWEKVSELPIKQTERHLGLAGCFAGIHNDVIIIAGGTNFPDKLPWRGGVKKWYKDIYILDRNNNFQTSYTPFNMPEPLAYGVSVSTSKGVVCIGGNNQDSCSRKVFRVSYNLTTQDIELTDLPDLPIPLSCMAGCMIDNIIYVAGGQVSMVSPSTSGRFFKLNLALEGTNKFQWEELKSWPGQPRAFHVMVAQNDGATNCVFLFSGRNYGPQKPIELLTDGYKYDPILNEWFSLSANNDTQFPVMGGCGFASGNEFIIFPNGDDGESFRKEVLLETALENSKDEKRKLQVNLELIRHFDNHPGFQTKGWVYNTITGSLIQEGELPCGGIVTAPLVKSQDNEVFIISGEIRPGVRTPNILRGTLISDRKNFGGLNTSVLIFYFGVLVWIGYFFSRRQKSTNDYFKGGGRVPWWAAGLSIFGTALSAITFMAIPAKSYATNWSYIWLNFAILIIAPFVIHFFIPLFRKLNITSAYEYLEKRFNLLLRLAGSITFIVFQIGRMGVVLFLPAIALNVVTGLDIYICILLMGLLSLLYTFMGGIEAVIWTDAMQVIVLLGGAILSLVLIIFNVDGGFSGIIQTAIADNKFSAFEIAFDLRQPTFWVVLFGGIFSQFVTYGTDQTMVQRYLTTSNLKETKNSLWTNVILTIPATLLFFFVGTALYIFYKENPDHMNFTLNNGDSIFPWFIVNELPDGVIGVLISGIFAAAMSSVSSSINSAATAYSVDIHFRFRPNTQKHGLEIARIATIVIGLCGVSFALFMASWDIRSLWDVFNKVLGLITGSVGGLFILGILFKQASSKGAMIGFFGSLLFQVYVATQTDIHLLLYTASGVIFCLVLGIVASWVFPDNNDKHKIERPFKFIKNEM